MKLFSGISRRRRDRIGSDLYRAVLSQARQPRFYADLGVPDTLDGRFDLIVLHAFLVMRRLKDGDKTAETATQALFDILFADLDSSLREMGVGDLGVGKRIKAMGQAFYGRTTAYDKALQGDDADLAEAIGRNLYGTAQPNPAQLAAMVVYTRAQAAWLTGLALADIQAGKVRFAPTEPAPQID